MSEELIKALQEMIDAGIKAGIKGNPLIAEIKERFNNKTITTYDLCVYAQQLGDLMTAIYSEVLPEECRTDVTSEEIKEVIQPSLEYVLTLIDNLGKGVILQIHEEAGIGLKPVNGNGGTL